MHATSANHELSPHVLTRLLPTLQVAPSEGTLMQIGLLSQDIHRLTVGLCPSLHSRTGAGEAPGVWGWCWAAPGPTPEPVASGPLLAESRWGRGLGLEPEPEPGETESSPEAFSVGLLPALS